MKQAFIGLFAIALTSVCVTSCTKSQDAPETVVLNESKSFNWRESTPIQISNHYHAMAQVDDVYVYDTLRPFLSAFEFEQVFSVLEPLGLWSRQQLIECVAVGDDSPVLMQSSEHRYNKLCDYIHASRNMNESELETIARRNTGNANANGSGVFWDASPQGLAYLLASVGQSQPFDGTLNYARTGASANAVTFSDVLRAANGLANTTFDNVVEILDVVYEFQVSGDGNWLIGAVVSYQGTEYVYSNFEVPGLPNLGPLVYDPQDGGVYIVGPMPGGIVSVNVTGQFSAPVE